jgi:hypothetical protein
MEGNWVAGGEWRVTGFEWGILDFGLGQDKNISANGAF